jgi:hypothetical protein
MLIDYVLHIDHPQAIYEFDEKSGRYSVRMVLGHPQAGTDRVTLAFKFMCKNSCPSGMNRRPTEVIFTLENERYHKLSFVSAYVKFISISLFHFSRHFNFLFFL